MTWHGLRSAFAVMIAASLAASCGSSTSKSSQPEHAGTARHPATIMVKLPGTAGRKGTLATLAALPPLKRSAVHSRLTGFSGTTVPEKLASYASDVANLWTLEFQHFGPIELPPATVEIIGQSPVACGTTQVTTDGAPAYCAQAQAIDLPLATLEAKVAPLGDAALLLVVADLYGYHVENALGLLGSSSGSAAETLDSCLSGVYFLYAEAPPNNHLQAVDETAVNNLMALQAGPATTGTSGVTAAQLTSAFNRGLMSGLDYRVCTNQSG